MSDTSELEKRLTERLTEMESHLAHQEGTIQDLSDIIAGQSQTITALSDKVERLKERLLALEDDVLNPQAKDAPPPHY